jgi:hypothetical protein
MFVLSTGLTIMESIIIDNNNENIIPIIIGINYEKSFQQRRSHKFIKEVSSY